MPKRSNEIPGSPEIPKDNFHVSAVNPEGIFRIALSDFVSQQIKDFSLSDSTPMDGQLFVSESTAFRINMGESGFIELMLASNLDLTYTSPTKAPYFTIKEINTISDELANRRVVSIIDDTTDPEEIRLQVLKDEYEIQAIFPTRKNHKHPATVKVALLQINGKNIDSAPLSEVSVKPNFDTPAHFTQMLELYAFVYGHVINSIYIAKKIEAPNIDLYFGSPTSNETEDDIFKSLRSGIENEPDPEQESNEPKLTFEDIAGQDEAVDIARQIVDFINNPEDYEMYGDQNLAGILLVGPPGTGKSLLARIIADQADAKFFEISVGDISSKWYGEAEQNMQAVFDEANKATIEGSKAIIFIDEFDSMFASREDAHEVTKRVSQVYLKNTGGKNANPNLLIIGATNRPKDIDEAFKRAGRIDLIVEMKDPETAEQRRAILDIHIRHKEANKKNSNLIIFDPQIDWDYIAQESVGLNGADLYAVIKTAGGNKTYQQHKLGLSERQPVNQEDILATIRKISANRVSGKKRPMGFDTSQRIRVKNK